MNTNQNQNQNAGKASYKPVMKTATTLGITPSTPIETDADKALKARVAELQAENTALRAAKFEAKVNRKLSAKVSAKGAVSVYGLGQWPVTLYLEQWLALANNMPMIQGFIDANLSQLTVKA